MNVPGELARLIEDAAAHIRAAVEKDMPILLRYNNDTDGVTGALALSRALKKLDAPFIEHENNSALYGVDDARKDVEEMRAHSASFLIIVIDFGANPESIDALELAKSAGADILIVDHHPFDKRAKELATCFLSPWAIGLDSNYAAGFLSGELAERLAGTDAGELKFLSLLGDRSNLLPDKEKTPQRQKISQAIDYVASYDRMEQTLAHYERIVSDMQYADKLYKEALARLQRARKNAAPFTRVRRIGPFTIQFVKFDKAVLPGEFPPKGKLVSLLHDELAVTEKGPLVSIGYGEKYITFRANDAAKSTGFNASTLIKELKDDMPDAIESGGGHDKAASLRVKAGFDRIILDEVLKRLEGRAPAPHLA